MKALSWPKNWYLTQAISSFQPHLDCYEQLQIGWKIHGNWGTSHLQHFGSNGDSLLIQILPTQKATLSPRTWSTCCKRGTHLNRLKLLHLQFSALANPKRRHSQKQYFLKPRHLIELYLSIYLLPRTMSKIYVGWYFIVCNDRTLLLHELLQWLIIRMLYLSSFLLKKRLHLRKPARRGHSVQEDTCKNPVLSLYWNM